MAIEFVLPEVGEGIESGTVIALKVDVGDVLEVDQVVLELETDKAVVDIPSNVSGIVKETLVKEAQEVKIGQSILRLEEIDAVERNTKIEEAKEPAKEEQKAESLTKANETLKVVGENTGVNSDSKRVDLLPAAPSVRRVARELGIDLHKVKGSGILGRISLQDLQAHGAEPTPNGLPVAKLPDFSIWGETSRKPMTGIRKATVRSMTSAWSSIPMVTHFDKADSSNFESFRQRYKKQLERNGIKLTPTAILLKIVATALAIFPDFNASIDTLRQEVIYKNYINVGVAVDTPNGLLVPVIKNANTKSITELAQELGEMAEKARNRKLSLADMQGGNFTISNLGGIGGYGFSPIVNPPEVAILGVSRSTMEPVYNKETASFDAKLMMPLALTYDHRLIDGASAARFVRWLAMAIEDAMFMSL